MQQIRILIINERANDAVILIRQIQMSGFEVRARHVDHPDALRTALELYDWDMVFCDSAMRGFDSIEALAILTSLAPQTPFIVTSGDISENSLVELIQAGAYDVLHEDYRTRASAVIERALNEKKKRKENKVVRTLLDESESRFRSLVEALPDSIIVCDKDGKIVFVNEGTRRLMKSDHDEDLLGRHFASLVDPSFHSDVAGRFEEVMHTGVSVPMSKHIGIALDGSRLPVEASATRIRWSGNPALLVVFRDISGRHEVLVRVKRSEARARAVLQNVADGVIIVDENGTITTFNRAAENMFGYSAGEVVGRSIEHLMPDDIAANHKSYMTRYLSTGVGRIIGQGERELPARRKDGTMFTAEATISETSVDGERIFIGALRDVTDRKASEKALSESEMKFRLVFETAPYGMALLAPDGRWIQANKALCDMVGYNHKEILDLNFQTITHPDDLETNVDLVRQVVDGEIPTYQMEKRYIRKDGAIIWILQSTALVRDDDGNSQYFISQSVDVSALKRAEEEKARLENELRHAQKMESLGTLSGGIAHEFNNLLLPICGLIELSLDAVRKNPDVRENLETALENANRATALVAKILSFSRSDDCEMVRTNFAAAIEQAVALLQITIPSTVHTSKDMDDVGEVYIDKTQISQIVLNLGVNAMHAIGDEIGQIAFKLKAETFRKRRSTSSGQLSPGRYARLSVIDTGCGMDEETVMRIFEPFFTTKDVGYGTGMGLAFVHGVIKTHGGMIDVKSLVGRGTTFDLFFPLEREASTAAADSAAA